MRQLGVTLLVLGLLLVACGTANAIYTYAGQPYGTLYYENGVGTEAGYGTYGTQFISNITANVIQLGVWDHLGDGFHTSHDVALFDLSGTMLASTSLSAGLSGTLIDGYRYQNVYAPIVSGQTYVVAATYQGSSNYNLVDLFGAQAQTDPHFTLVRDLWDWHAGAPPFPTLSNWNSSSYGWYGPNLRADVPEPGTILLLGFVLTLGSVAALRRRSR